MPTKSRSSTTTSDRDFGPFHPGEILREEFLLPLGLTTRDLAAALHLEPGCLDSVVAGREPLTAEIALRLSRYFGTTPEFWMNLQLRYDLESALLAAGEQIAREVKPRTSSPAGDL